MIALDGARAPISFVVLTFEGEHLQAARDFRYARYALEGAVIELA